MIAKKELRKEMQRQRALLIPGWKAGADQHLCEALLAIIISRKARCVHTFLPMGNEPDIFPLIRQLLQLGITVVAPEALPGGALRHHVLSFMEPLNKGIYGTSFPASGIEYHGDYDLIIVPGLAFDQRHYRLGYGAGYYDRFLAEHPGSYKIGIAYPFQVMHEIPAAPHDVPLDEVVIATM